ncbi:MAG: hypothetical protein MSB10_05635 [Clostridiales bacterium]|nr:hypothetical protein [Clostridiales bacterium]
MRGKQGLTVRMGSLCLCGLLYLSLLPGAAQAYTMEPDGFTITPNQETLDFWTQHKYLLNDRGIYEVSADGWNFCAEFHDGLLRVNDSISPPDGYTGYWTNYVDKNGNLHDLNRGRYADMYSFSGGYAAVIGDDGGVYSGLGYVNTKGNKVVSPHGDYTWLEVGSSTTIRYAGSFINGRALVLRKPEVPSFGFGTDAYRDTTTYNPNAPERWYGFEYAYIDPNGKLLTGWTLIQDWEKVTKLPLYDQDGVWIGHREHGNSVSDPHKPGSGGQTGQPEQPEQPFVPEFHAPALPEYNKNAPSLFASTAKITGVNVGMAAYGGMDVTVTNPTDVTDAGVVALVAFSQEGSQGEAGVFFLPYEVPAGSSKTYTISTPGIVHQGIFNGVWESSGLPELMERYVDAAIVTFSDDADLHAFYNTIPYEQYWYPRGSTGEFQPVCDGPAGTAWLADVMGFQRTGNYLSMIDYYPPGHELQGIPADTVDHSVCER